MSEPSDHNHLHRSVEIRREREAEWRATGERPVWRNFSMIGALGWLIVTPMLLGALLGHLLDAEFGQGVFWTGSLIFLGAVIGFYFAWRRMMSER